MFRLLTHLPISRRLFMAAALTAIIPGIVISLLGSSYVNTLTTMNDAVTTSNNAVKLVTDMQAGLLRMNALLATLGTGNTTSPSVSNQTQREVVGLTNDFSRNLSSYKSNYEIVTSDSMKSIRGLIENNGLGDQTQVSQHTLIFVIHMQWQVYDDAQSAVLKDLKDKADMDTFANDLARANLMYLPLKGSLDNLVGLTESISQVVAEVNTLKTTPIILSTVFALLFSIIVVFVISYIVNTTIATPLRQLAELTKRIATGETSVRARVSGNDEIRMVADSMNSMLDSIVHFMQQTQEQHDILQARVDKLISEVSGIGEGDLRMQAEVTPDAIGVLAQSFNYMMFELSNLVIQVKKVAHEVKGLTAVTVQRMTQLVRIGDHQIQQMQEAVSEVEQMAHSTRQVAERAHTLSVIALQTRHTAEYGQRAVQKSAEGIGRMLENVQAMSEKVQLLRENSREINYVVSVISNIAHQTNRLALDASIQAAVAGENGKGFAAVASDIRRLAEQTKGLVSTISSLVRTVNESTDQVAVSMQDTERETATGAELAREVDTALESIFDAVERQAQEIDSINSMANHQLQLSKAVGQIMQSVSLFTHQSGDSTRNTSQNMGQLSSLVEQLNSSVEAFKLSEELIYSVPGHQQQGLYPLIDRSKPRNTSSALPNYISSPSKT